MVVGARLLATLVSAGLLATLASCAAVWGYDPLTLAPDDAEAEDGSTNDASIDHDALSGDSSLAPDASHATDDATSPSDTSVAPVDAGADAFPSTLTCLSSNGTCTCNANGSGNTAACSPAAVGIDSANMICCADPSYPANGACMCNWIGCTTSGSNNCICGPSNGAPGGSCAAQSWTCCLQTGAPECVCSAAACMPGFTDFGNSCAVKDVKCAAPAHRVDTCR